MSWWVVVLWSVPASVVMAVATVISVALSVSAEDEARRLHLHPGARSMAVRNPGERGRQPVRRQHSRPPSVAFGAVGTTAVAHGRDADVVHRPAARRKPFAVPLAPVAKRLASASSKILSPAAPEPRSSRASLSTSPRALVTPRTEIAPGRPREEQ